jgi:hypothetical protein
MTRPSDDPRLDRLARVLDLVLEFSGLNRSQLAARLGSDYPVRRILAGHKDVRVGQLLAFADAVGLKPIELLRLAFDGGDARPSPLLQRLEVQRHRLTEVLASLRPLPPPEVGAVVEVAAPAAPTAPPGADPAPPPATPAPPSGHRDTAG